MAPTGLARITPAAETLGPLGILSSVGVAHGAPSGKIRPLDARNLHPVPLHNIKSGAHYSLRLFDAQGKLRRQALLGLRNFLACTRSGIDHPIHWRLATILHAVAAHWPKRTIHVISGYRHPKQSRDSRRSNHTRGRAIDFRVEGVSNRELRDTLRRSFRGIGVGYYPNSTFVHLDVRDHDGQWVDYSGPGQDPCYSPDSRADLHSGVAESLSYQNALRRGCKGKSRQHTARRKVAVRQDAPDSEHGGTRPDPRTGVGPAQAVAAPENAH